MPEWLATTVLAALPIPNPCRPGLWTRLCEDATPAVIGTVALFPACFCICRPGGRRRRILRDQIEYLNDVEPGIRRIPPRIKESEL